jgi:hypothetical protein
MKWLILYIVFNALNPSFEQCSRQIHESVRERKVTINMMEDRLHCVTRREGIIRELIKDLVSTPDEIINELYNLKKDRKSLSYIIQTLKETT